MAGSLVQFRVDESMNIKAANICEQLGMDLATYLRMCMSRLVQENGVPFSMKLEEDAYLVTGNRKHFPSAPFIVTPRQMIDIVLKDI